MESGSKDINKMAITAIRLRIRPSTEKRSPARAILSISRFHLERRARTIPVAAKKKEVPQQRKRMEMTPRISEAIDS